VRSIKNSLLASFILVVLLIGKVQGQANVAAALTAVEAASHEDATTDTIIHEAAVEHTTSHESTAKFNPSDVIKHHVGDAHNWEFFSFGGHSVGFNLPCIIKGPEGISMFSFGKIAEGGEYEGYGVNHHTHKIERADGQSFLDFSITKNVLSLLISAILLLVIFISIAGKYKKQTGKAPNGLQNALEPIILFVQDEVAKPMLGNKYMKFLPYLLTVFFFIWINNLLGLIPGGANLTGNTACTIVLAGITFLLIMFSSNKHYWQHIFAMPGVPKAVLIILTPVEILGVFIKPFALMIRLFANILAGHMIILTVVSLIFIFAEMSTGLGWGTAIFSMVFGVFMFCIELLVAFVQAYIFTILSALFIGEACADSHAEEHH
jgi:F-type H+-transporting ATPase subunit a